MFIKDDGSAEFIERAPGQSIVLFQNYYIDKDPERDDELKFCLRKNIENPLIDKICLVSEIIVPDQRKIVWVPVADRPTFSYLFLLMRDYLQVGEIGVLANSDIFFNGTLSIVQEIDLTNSCLALSRWEYPEMEHFSRDDSQDVWIFSQVPTTTDSDFMMGEWGCDNRIAHEIQKEGYRVLNPSRSIQALHLHKSSVRNRVSKISIPKPYYMIKPVHLIVGERL